MLLRTTFPHSFTVHPSVLVSFFSPIFWLLAIALFVGCLGSPAVDAVSILPDDAELACRAILPDCFRRSDWADLYVRETSVAVAHPADCRDAGFEPGQFPQGR